MSFLPIVERELRVRARQRTTYWTRFFLALGVFLLWGFLIAMAPSGFGRSRGHMLFSAIATVMFVFGLLSGVFITADCISEEKREGTLGLLFLTDLEGYDIVGGKLAATALPALYGSMACVPLLAYSWLLGGVTAGEFWRVTIAIIATLLFSLSIGLLISAFSREARSAMGLTLLTLGAVTGLFPFLGLQAAAISKTSAFQFLSSPSPVCLYSSAFDSSYSSTGGALRFWTSLITILICMSAAMAISAWHVADAWQQKDENSGIGTNKSRTRSLRFGHPTHAFRGRLLDANPFQWLSSRDRLPTLLGRSVCGVLFLAWLGFLLGIGSTTSGVSNLCLIWTGITAYGLHHVLKWLIAIEASRRFNQERQSGTLESVLVTPLSVGGIIAGQRRALVATFLWPLLLAYTINTISFVYVLVADPLPRWNAFKVIVCEICIGGALMLAVDFQALTWVGMWMGLTKPRHHRAILATLARIMLVPWVAIFVLVLLTIGGGSIDFSTFLNLSLLWFGLAAVIESTFIARAKVGLLEAFRQISSDPNPDLTSAAWNQQATALKPREAS